MEATKPRPAWMRFIARYTGISAIRRKMRQARELSAQTRCGMKRLEDIHQRLARLANRTEIMFGQIDSISEIFSEHHKHKLREYVGLLRDLHKQRYVEMVRSGALPVPQLFTDHPIALATNDTLHPRGAKNDNSICPRFNRRLYALLGQQRPLKVLDIGCAGGGLVRSLIDDGHLAVGLEGSDYPWLTKKDEWGTIPHHLHTCDVTKPFALRDSVTGSRIQFDAITAWELMEHIPEASLPTLLENIRSHLAPDGWVLCSIATFLDVDEKHGWIYHVTVKPREWWVEQFAKAGLVATEQDCIGKYDWVRGSGQCFGDWTEEQGLGFHLALRHARRVPAPHVDFSLAGAAPRPHAAQTNGHGQLALAASGQAAIGER
ncbi:MAG: class I SAM-dependent methyltransferase [Pirellulales bacterium]